MIVVTRGAHCHRVQVTGRSQALACMRCFVVVTISESFNLENSSFRSFLKEGIQFLLLVVTH
jgi:hypothetical protein